MQSATCTIEGCTNPIAVKSRGWCNVHYKRWHRLGDPNATVREGRTTTCSVEGCTAGGDIIRGFCHKHYTRWKRHGDPLAINATERGSVRVEAVEFNGITFRRYPDSDNAAHARYFKPGGQWINKGVQALHQEVWKAAHGPIPDGYEVHHRDRDFTNNDLANLECIPRADHRAEHAEEFSRIMRSERQLAHLAAIRPLASAWHRSEEGRAWHREHARKVDASGTGVQPHDE